MKKFIKGLIFILIFVVIWHNVFSVLWLTPNSIREVYKEPKNSIDVAYFGASNAYAHFNTTLAYHDYGFTTAMMSSDTQPFIGVKFLLEEVRKRQNPEVYVIDISSAYEIPLEEGTIRNITDSLKFSSNRNDAIKYLLTRSTIPQEDYINYYFSFLTYHNVYKGVNKYKYKNLNLYKGFLFSNLTAVVEPQVKTEWVNDTKKLPLDISEGMDDLISYIKDNNLNVLFVLSPKVYSLENMQILNKIIEKIKYNDLKVLNLNNVDLNIDYSHDYYNFAHLNIWGSTKMTEYLAKYLNDNYNLEDHRNDKKYASWSKEYERLKKNYKILTEKDFDDLIR